MGGRECFHSASPVRSGQYMAARRRCNATTLQHNVTRPRTDARAVLHFAPPSHGSRTIAARALSRFTNESCYLKRFGEGAPTQAPIAAPRQAAVGRGPRPADVASLALAPPCSFQGPTRMALLIAQSAAFIDSSAGAKHRPETQARPLSPARRGDWVGASAFTVPVRYGPDSTWRRDDVATQRRCNTM